MTQKQQNTLWLKNWANDLNWYFYKKYIKKISEYMESSKSKPQRDTTSHLLEYLLIKANKQTENNEHWWGWRNWNPHALLEGM